MTATARQFVITDEQLENAGGGSYAAIEVPGDYEAVLVAVEDYDKNAGGWKATFRIQGLPFNYWVSFSDASRWKLIAFVQAFDPTFFERRAEDGTTPAVPINDFVGITVGAYVVLDEELDTPRKVIDSVFSLEEELPESDDVPAL